jgi:protein O-GlcNAc transferase
MAPQKPIDIQAAFARATALHQQGNLKEAAPLYQHILAADPANFDAHHMLGVLRAQQGRFLEAVKAIAHALKVSPRNQQALANFGNVLKALGQFDEALLSYDTALSVDQSAAVTWFNRGLVLWDMRRFEEAVASYGKALAIAPNYAEALLSRAAALRDLGRFEEALSSCDAAIGKVADSAEAFNLRGVLLWRLKRFDAALDSYNIALSILPRAPEVLNNRSLALMGLERGEEALQSCDAALAIKPGYVEALNNRGIAQASLQQLDQALQSYDRAIALKPDYLEALNNKGGVLAALGRFDEALACYDALLKFDPASSSAQYNSGLALAHLHRFDEALIRFEGALASSPRHPYALSAAANAALNLCDWARVEALGGRIARDIVENRSVISPFTLLGYSADASLHLQCAKIYLKDKGAACRNMPRGSHRHEKLRIAYVSSDFGDHPVAHQIVDLLERHDRALFEIHGISLGPDDGSDIRARLMQATDRFHDVQAMHDRDAAGLMRQLEIDIAVDLNGHTQDARPGLFAGRAAPVQVNYLGYPATIGSTCMDYILADPVVAPLRDQPFYTEAIVHLPDSYFASARPSLPPSLARRDAGLPETGVVFCCFNQNWKITALVFDVWMRLLREVSGSVLWLRECAQGPRSNLQREAEARGVAADRLIFAGKADRDRYLARLQLADMVLDTLPYNAHATASDALWAGVPVITCAGQAFAGRVAASLLQAAGLAELVTASLADYESLALTLARDPGALASLREKLARNRVTAPLFDTDRTRRNIEAAYRRMWEIAARGGPPAPFAVASTGEIHDSLNSPVNA